MPSAAGSDKSGQDCADIIASEAADAMISADRIKIEQLSRKV